MATYSVAEAKNRLPALIAAAERGEPVTITRHGRPVAELRPVGSRQPRPMTVEDFDRLQQDLAKLGLPKMEIDGATLVQQMRDECDD